MTDTPLLRIEDVVAGYVPGVDILRGCSLSADAGELVGIIGPNGAGKSTLLKAVFGEVSVRSGTVHLGDDDVTGLPARRLVERGVGFVPQSDNVFRPMTIQENLEIGLHREPSRVAERVEAMLELFPELVPLRRNKAGSLSGGQRQMLAMARALMPEPRVLLLDEPSAGLSPVKQDETFLQVHRIKRSGVCVLMVEQNAHRCLQVADRAYVLDQGRDAHTGTGRELMDDPKVVELYLGTLAG
jgi:branched-chain amino acid transport system ATP-binding protein